MMLMVFLVLFLSGFREDGEEDGEEVYYGEFCDGCVEKMRRIWAGTRERVWKDCEELFGIRRGA